MNRAYPIRSEEHQLEEQSERFFRDFLPRSWTCEKTLYDYGVDLRVEVFEEEAARSLELLVQLKASKKATRGDSEVVRLRTATYNFLWDKLQVVMLVKYVEEENEAYWLLVRDIPTTSQSQDTFSVHIPKTNQLSKINWMEIQSIVRGVTDKKLAAGRSF